MNAKLVGLQFVTKSEESMKLLLSLAQLALESDEIIVSSQSVCCFHWLPNFFSACSSFRFHLQQTKIYNLFTLNEK